MVSFLTEIFLTRWKTKKRALINDLHLREASRLALQCWKLNFQHYKCPSLHYDLSRKVHVLHYHSTVLKAGLLLAGRVLHVII